MAVSIGDLLTDAHENLQATPTSGISPTTAASAAAGLAPVGRALEFLHRARPHPDWVLDPRPFEVIDLTTACLDAARTWPGHHGRVPDLLGAAADAIATRVRQYSDQQREALTVALAETARRCAESAERFGPYAQVPQLSHARAAAARLERHATRRHAGYVDWTVLDQLIPAPNPARSWADRVLDAAARLHETIEGHGPNPHLAMADVILTITASHLAASHATTLLPGTTSPAAAAPTAWRAARIECRAFDDGSKRRPLDDSQIAMLATLLGRTLHERLGAPPSVGEPSGLDAGALSGADRSALYSVVVLLPDIAESLSRVARVWAECHQVWAPERQLLSYENRNYTVTSTNRNAPAEHVDLDGLRSSLGLAATLTSALVEDVGAGLQTAPTGQRVAPAPGPADVPGVGSREHLSISAQSAHDALRRAQALHPRETVLPAGRQQPRPRRR